MRSFWSDPYLWIHLAGIAALPIWLELCFLGLAIGDPILPVPLELLLIAIIGIAPVLWMQWQRPFCIFSLLLVALRPNQLSPEQRKILRLFKQENRLFTLIVPVFLIWVLWQLYQLAPLAEDLVSSLPSIRLMGLLIAAIAFLGSNLFFQVPVSILPVLLTSEAKFTAIDPYPIEQVTKDFTLLGWQVKRILPDLKREPSSTKPPMAAPAVSAVVTPTRAPSEMATTTPEVDAPNLEPAIDEMSDRPNEDSSFS
jgi:hypothetical protein